MCTYWHTCIDAHAHIHTYYLCITDMYEYESCMHEYVQKHM
jgi:hypothetical protein